MKILTLLTVGLAVALGMPPSKDKVPGPMVEDGPPLKGPVEDVAPVPEDKQEIQTRWGHHCAGFSHNDRCYRFFRGPKRADDAEVFCQRLSPGGHLASITSKHLHREVTRLMLRSNGAPARAWVGGFRQLTSGRFIWLDGSSWSYADWLPGRPNASSNVDNCVEMLANGKFNDQRCRQTKAFICSHPE